MSEEIVGEEIAIIEDAELVDDHTPSEQAGMSLFGTSDPVLVVEKASRVASALKDVLRHGDLVSNIQGREYIKVEGWTTLGAMLGVTPRVAWSKPLDGGAGWEARVEVVRATATGEVIIAAAEAQCSRSERSWSGRDEFAIRSMAQTRAMGKALRMPLGWIAVLAGYEATPAEEMPVRSKTPKARVIDPGTVSPYLEDEPVKTHKQWLKELREGLKALEYEQTDEQGNTIRLRPPGWSDKEVIASASRLWGREIKSFNEFADDEIEAILTAMPKETK